MTILSWASIPPISALATEMALESCAAGDHADPMAIRDWPADERPREKLLEKGAAALSDAELLAILLRTGTRGRSAVDLAREVLKSFHSLRKLIASDRQRFCAEPGLGPARYAELQASVEIARRQLSETLRAGPSLSSPPGHAGFSDRAATRPGARSVLLPFFGQTSPADPVRRTVSRHHRWRQRAPARDRQAGAATKLGGCDH